ncbi:MAG: C-terminal binding protein [Halobacteriota archaeon]
MSFEVVFTDHTFDDLHIEEEILSEVGAEVIDATKSDESIESLAASADGLIVMYEEIGADLIGEMDDCKVISRTGIGFDNVDLDAATERNIYVTNVPDYCISEVSDHTIALMLALKRNVVAYDRDTRQGGWDLGAGDEMRRLSEQSIGLLAFGNIAKEVGRKAAAFGMEVLAHDPYLSAEDIREAGATPVEDLDKVLERADVLSVHPPLTPETRGMISTDEFEQMKDSAIVLNVARGGIIDEDALVEALDAGEIAGAGLDVIEDEPPEEDDPLVQNDRVILTPHAAWNSTESMIELREKAARNVRDALAGEAPKYVVNRSLLE